MAANSWPQLGQAIAPQPLAIAQPAQPVAWAFSKTVPQRGHLYAVMLLFLLEYSIFCLALWAFECYDIPRASKT